MSVNINQLWLWHWCNQRIRSHPPDDNVRSSYMLHFARPSIIILSFRFFILFRCNVPIHCNRFLGLTITNVYSSDLISSISVFISIVFSPCYNITRRSRKRAFASHVLLIRSNIVQPPLSFLQSVQYLSSTVIVIPLTCSPVQGLLLPFPNNMQRKYRI